MTIQTFLTTLLTGRGKSFDTWTMIQSHGPDHLGFGCGLIILGPAAPGVEAATRLLHDKANDLIKPVNTQSLKQNLVPSPTNTEYNPTPWPQSPRILMRCATRASNGPNRLGLPAYSGCCAGTRTSPSMTSR